MRMRLLLLFALLIWAYVMVWSLVGCAPLDQAGTHPGELTIQCTGKATVNGVGTGNVATVLSNNNFSVTTDCGPGASVVIKQGMPTP